MSNSKSYKCSYAGYSMGMLREALLGVSLAGTNGAWSEGRRHFQISTGSGVSQGRRKTATTTGPQGAESRDGDENINDERPKDLRHG